MPTRRSQRSWPAAMNRQPGKQDHAPRRHELEPSHRPFRSRDRLRLRTRQDQRQSVQCLCHANLAAQPAVHFRLDCALDHVSLVLAWGFKPLHPRCVHIDVASRAAQAASAFADDSWNHLTRGRNHDRLLNFGPDLVPGTVVLDEDDCGHGKTQCVTVAAAAAATRSLRLQVISTSAAVEIDAVEPTRRFAIAKSWGRFTASTAMTCPLSR